MKQFIAQKENRNLYKLMRLKEGMIFSAQELFFVMSKKSKLLISMV